MDALTLLFVAGLLLAAIFVTLLVRKDFAAREELKRQRQRQTMRRPRGR